MAEMLFHGDFLNQIPYLVAALLPALTFHEWGHAYMAKFFGDDTAQRAGRLTLNPMAHLDMMGTLAIFLIGFGWAKPVPINPTRMKGRWAEFWVASAGPLMNLALALLFSLLFHLHAYVWFGAANAEIVIQVIQISLFLNLALCFFNLIPIGPLDGRTIFAKLLPLRQSMSFELWNARYGSMLLLAIIVSEFILPIGILRFLVGTPTMFLAKLLM